MAENRTANFDTVQCLNILLALCLTNLVYAQATPADPLVSAIYIFGDSIVDPGNNNGFATIVKANFPPYGIDFVDQKPTGRFTDGRLATDILSGLAGLPDIVLAYLDPQFQGSQILTGASFASAAAGYYDNTSLGLNILNLGKQVENFREYRGQLENMIGPKNASKIISGGLFGICVGTNDFLNNYYFNPITRTQYTVTQFQDLLLNCLLEFIEQIYTEGATRFFVMGLPPFGCLPSQITLHNLIGNACVEEFNNVAVSFNNRISSFLETIKPRFPGLRMGYIDIYNKLFDMIKNPSIYGFEEVRKGCCGTGLLETTILCNRKTPICPDRSKYVFWDSFHPTTTAYTVLAQNAFPQIVKLLR